VLRIVGILLAAGSGSRFGGGKLAAALGDGVPVGVRSLRTLRSVVAEVIVVTRPEDDALRAALVDEGARIEICPRAAEGMGASLAHGVAASSDADAWIVALGDMPRIRAQTIRAVATALAGGAVIAAPTYRGERGHPVGFAAVLRERLVALTGDAGARDILRAERGRVTLVECDDAGILADVDTSEDLERLRRDGG
jgi:molybdenum cofactor cytidylyltransferase